MHLTSTTGVLVWAITLVQGTVGAIIPKTVASTTAPTTTSSVPAQVSSSASSQLTSLTTVSPTKAAPTNASQLNAALQAIYTATTTDLSHNVASQVAAGLIGPTGLSLGGVVSSLLGSTPLLSTGENSITNINLRVPSKTIFPTKASGDAPYSLTEAELRAAIYIPSSFTYGTKTPVIFVPGTASYGGINFASNLRKLLTGVSYADPVWLNIPGASLGDIQVNSEYVAYAINYISAISSNKNVSVISWSQGGVNTQWAFTFWPSTRSVVTDFIPISPDFHGTVLANAICLSVGAGTLSAPYCPPAADQQEYNSNLITAFRAKGGDTAYVPTTVLYSGVLDEIVEPQQGTGASAYLLGNSSLVTNNEFQTSCPVGSAGAGVYGHATSLYHPLSYALVVDALTHDGPGELSRLDLSTVCAAYSAPGLTIADNLETVGLLPVALVLVLLYVPKVITEPALMSYV